MATTTGNPEAEKPAIELDPKYDHYDYPITSPDKKSGHAGHTTKEQDAQLHQLRAVLEQLGYKDRLDTLTLLRFLRARKFNVSMAKQMFVDCEKWRKEFGTDYLVGNFTYEEKPLVSHYYPQYYHKTDKLGRPIYIEQLGKIDLAAMYKITTAEKMLQNLVVEFERFADPRLPACSRKAGRLLETSCTIMDLKGVGLSNMNSVYGYVKQASAISQNYYPERMGKLYLINAPWGFSSIFSIVKGFLDPVTVEKISILGSGYQTELLKQIPSENLPKQFGGVCECKGGCGMTDPGPWQDPQWARPPKWAEQKDATKTTDDAATADDTTTAGKELGEGDKAQKPTPTTPADPRPSTTPTATTATTTTTAGAGTATVSMDGGASGDPSDLATQSSSKDAPPAPQPGATPAPATA